ncbi:RNA-dependent RNA polymerase [Yongsan bunyavirus 1]|uniref:RNA-dependent RNA polymerase n=1 Tax=Yongsan bunyavirus 1 TaxID=2315803 RepID=UPI000EB71A49|nr:RNA-dependent RNA polymerase [Yongsan bunyavirus 1]AXV43873.1 RNA-dependent RNA polymerase [Yongsan bunyavirus 1]
MIYDLTEAGGHYLRYVPRTERPDEENQLTPITRLRHVPRQIRAQNPHYDTICQKEEDSRTSANTTAAQTYNYVKQIEVARHDLWYSAILKNLDPRWETEKQETKFTEFCLKKFELAPKPEDKVNNLTPDLMLVSPCRNHVFIGDVAVARSPGKINEEKNDKYQVIIDYLRKEKPRLNILHYNFIVAENLDNIEELINIFKIQHRVLKLDYNPEMDTKMTESASMLIRLIVTQCTEQQEYNRLRELNRIKKIMFDPDTLTKLIDVDLQRGGIDDYVPIRTEDELIDMIKARVEELGGASYYDVAPDDIDNAFKEVIEENEYTMQENDDGTKTKVSKRIMEPKATLKVCDNSADFTYLTDLDLIMDYVKDISKSDPNDVRDYLMSILPNTTQLDAMKKIKDNKMTRDEISKDEDIIVAEVKGPYQYKRGKAIVNNITNKFEEHVVQGSSAYGRNEKGPVEKLDTDSSRSFINFIDSAISYYGSLSGKPPILDDSWDTSNHHEEAHTSTDKEIYDYVRKTNGAQLCHSMSALFSRISHLSAHLGSHENVFTPPNGSFIAMMPKNHSPVTSVNCDMPFIFITRAKRSKPLTHVECEYTLITKDYIYYVSKLCRMNTRVISCWDNAGFRLVASASYLMSTCTQLMEIKEKVVGILTYMTLDVHQKVSEYMDLLKYIGFMPFSTLHKLPLLIKDKCNLIMKTRMDVWLFHRIWDFIKELMLLDKLNAHKPRLTTNNGIPTKESLGIHLELPSFCDITIRHKNANEYIEEMAVLNTLRPKGVYGSQFADVSTHNTVKWNIEFREEIDKYGGWAVDGHDETDFPFDSKFCYSADAVHYATLELMNHITETENAILNKVVKSQYCDFMHNNCSLRGCTKEVEDRGNQKDIHTTSITSCFKRYEDDKFNDKAARALVIGQKFIATDKKMEFAMSEKEQRGSGRPIATPTLTTKAALMMIEKPEAEMGKFMPNNILVAGKDKLREQHMAYTQALALGVRKGLGQVYQQTEDQTKFSENDNPYKYIPYIKSNNLLPKEIRILQEKTIRKISDRVHLVKRIPESIKNDLNLMGEVVDDSKHMGVKGEIGWPQGMLNNISTSVHCAADYWITKAFKKAYPSRRIETVGLVHSDDSWVTVCCDNEETFKLFSLFRTVAKQLFCLKLNIKKLWGGKYLGELVSHYNLNGHVHMSTGKVICNGMSNLTYQNWAIDVSNQISTIQQSLRAGATMGNIIMISTILRQQITSAYQIKGLQKRLLHNLPIELGGYPRSSAFRLAVTGVHAHYSDIYKLMTTAALTQEDKEIQKTIKQLITAAVALGIDNRTPNAFVEDAPGINEDDFLSVEIPTKGEIFRAVKHIMPKSKKMAYAVAAVRKVIEKEEFKSDGLALIVPRPKTLAESIGHYGDTAKTRQFELAAERYTQSTRKLAISQSMQSAGKTVRLNGSKPMTFDEMYKTLMDVEVTGRDWAATITAFTTESEVVIACDSIINASTMEPTDRSKGKVINRMPKIESIYSTISPIQDVLLTIIDTKTGSGYYAEYGSFKTSLDTRLNDARDIEVRFKSYFAFFEVKEACKVIMQGKLGTIKERSWIQPKVASDTIPNFLEDLYGATINPTVVYRVRSDKSYMKKHEVDQEAIDDIYSCLVLNSVYDGKIKILRYDGVPVKIAVNKIDHTRLDYNSKLKHAVCQMEFNNNPEYLNSIIRTETFAYEWIKTQNRTVDGKYYGDWAVKFMHADLVCYAESFAGVVTLRVNKLDKDRLLRGMRIMVQKCFSRDAYEYDLAWWTSRVWGSSSTTNHDAHHYLCSYNSYETQISMGTSKHCLSLYVDKKLAMRSMTRFVSPKSYSFDDYYRVIKANMMDNNFQESEFRVANIYQSIGVRRPEKVMLDNAIIDGYNNEMLLRHKVLEDLMLNRPLSLSVRDASILLESNSYIQQKRVLWNSFYYFAELAKIESVTRRLEILPTENNVTSAVIDLVETDMSSAYAAGLETEVESLSAIAVEYEITQVRGSKRLFKPNNITRELCKHIHKRNKPGTDLDILYAMLIHPDLKVWFRSYDWETFLTIGERYDKIHYIEYPRELFYFLYAYRWDTEDYWCTIDRTKLLPYNRDHNNMLIFNYIVEDIVDAFNDNYFEEIRIEMRGTLLDDVLRNC